MLKVALFDALVSGHHVEYAAFLASYLVEQGDEVHFYAWRPDPLLEPLSDAGATLHFLTSDPSRPGDGGLPRRLARLERGIRLYERDAAALGVDVVHNLYLEYGELAQYVSGWRNRRLAVRRFATLFWPHFIHDGDDHVSTGRRFYHVLVRKALGRMLRRGTLAALFVHTEDHRDMLARALGDATAAEGVRVVPGPPVELSNRAVPRTHARDLLGLPPNAPTVLFFGGLQRDKGIDILLRAVPLMHNDVVTVLAGEPVDISEDDVDAARRLMSNPARLVGRLGRVANEDVAAYMAAADAVILPYRKSHVGTSGVLMRATAHARPLVATDVGQIGPLVRDNGLGVVVEPESPQALAKGVAELFSRSEAWYKETGARAVEYASKNEWRTFGRRVRAAYLAAAGKA